MDDYSRYSWIFPLKLKSDAVTVFGQFKSLVGNIYNNNIKVIRCDEGGNYKPIIHTASQCGIQVQLACPYTSAHNGRVERKYRHVVEIRLALLAHAKMPLQYWWETFHTLVYLINRMPTYTIEGKVPFTVLNKEEPDYNSLRIFGATCYPCLRQISTS